MSDKIQRQIDSLRRSVNKYGVYIEDLEKEVAILKANSHPKSDFVCTTCGGKAKRVKDTVN